VTVLRTPALVFVALALSASMASAQSPCAIALDEATRAYDEGRLADAVAILSPCIDFNREQRWQAYRILALAYIFDDRPELAEEAVDRMLELNPTYQINEARDPIELIRIIEQYTIVPWVAITGRGGLSITGRAIDEPRSVVQTSDVAGSRRFTLGNDLGVGALVSITPDIALGVEALSSTRAYSLSQRSQAGSVTEYSERLSYLTVPAMLQYRFDLGPVVPHIAAGYFYQLLLGATSDIATRPNDTAAVFEDQGVLSTEGRRARSNHGLAFGAGVSLRLPVGFLSFDGRYELGFGDIVRSDERYNDDELLIRYLYVDNGFRLRNFILSIAYVYPLSFSATR
jgi:hypothetical protein